MADDLSTYRQYSPPQPAGYIMNRRTGSDAPRDVLHSAGVGRRKIGTIGSTQIRSRTACAVIFRKAATSPGRRFASEGARCDTGPGLVHQVMQLKKKIAALLMEAGASHNEQTFHKVGYLRAARH